MKHIARLAAVAAACAGTGVLAQQTPSSTPTSSSLNLYGTADAGLLSMSNRAAGSAGYIPTTSALGRSTLFKDGGFRASHWGLRGREHLGGGTSVLFQLQGNVNLSTGDAGGPNSSSGRSFFNQTAAIGLAGSFGEVKFGRQVSPMMLAMLNTDTRQMRYFGSALTALVGLNSASGAFIGNNSNAAFGTVYNDSVIIYTTPTWRRLTLHLAYAGGSGFTKANSQQTVALTYSGEQLRLSAFFYNGYGNNLPAATALYQARLGDADAARSAAAAAGFSTTANTNRLASVSALYTWKSLSFSGGYYRASNPAKAIVPGGSARMDMYTLGLGWQVRPGLNITTGYYYIKDKTNPGHRAWHFAAGMDYALSRRTSLYLQGAAVGNRGANMNLSPAYGTPVAANRSMNAWMIGMRHAF
ncbi:MAG: porin [Pseudomonadota bacterium]|nr:porin [Pseudomonadota bacterium]